MADVPGAGSLSGTLDGHAHMDRQSTIEIIRASAVAGLLISGVLVIYRLVRSRTRAALQRCAKEHGFEILSCTERFLTSGPFCWGTSGRASVFRLRVRDRDGRERFVWVRIGTFFASVLFDDTTEIRWEDTV